MIEIAEQKLDDLVSYKLRSSDDGTASRNFNWGVHWPGHELRNPIALDLLEIAKGIHMADRMFRRSLRLGQRTRRLQVRVPVSQPSLWRRVAAHLESMAQFVSTDDWRLEFTPTKRRINTKRSHPPPGTASVVALFSGGLDSLCGAAYLADRADENPIFVSHSPPGRENNLKLIQGIWNASRKLRLRSDQCVTFRLELYQRDARGLRCMFQEHSRRTRPFFFLALACAIAIEEQIPAVQMSENGALGMSLPLRSDAYGAQCTRQAHLYTLNGFAELMQIVAPRSGGWRVYNPFQQMTKGEACRLLREAPDLAKDAISCEYIGHQAAFLKGWLKKNAWLAGRIGEGPQCGICTPCLIRRAALYQAGVNDADDLYFFDARRVLDKDGAIRPTDFGKNRRVPSLYRTASPQVFFMRRFCEAVRGMSEFDFMVEYFPELRFLLTAEDRPHVRTCQCYRLTQKLSREMLQFLNSPRQQATGSP